MSQKNKDIIKGSIRWIDAIAGDTFAFKYLWGGPSYKEPHLGDMGKPIKYFEFKRNFDKLEDGDIFFYRFNVSDPQCNIFKMGVAHNLSSMYANGGHIYPIIEERWSIVKELAQ